MITLAERIDPGVALAYKLAQRHKRIEAMITAALADRRTWSTLDEMTGPVEQVV